MQASEYQQLYQTEGDHWWFRAMRLFVFRILANHNLSASRALDIGCGTGALLGGLSTKGYDAFGLDLSRNALDFARERENHDLVQASANDLPFKSAFDLVISVDVLEVDNIEPERMIARSVAALKPGGLGLFVMAAHQWLLSEHDRAVYSVRRYNLGQLRGLFDRKDVTILRSTYLFFLLFPLVAIRKLVNRPKKGNEPVSDVTIPANAINQVLFWLCWCEDKLLGWTNFPIGSSALVLVRKNG
jgi:SAM-dependent methyltransferase